MDVWTLVPENGNFPQNGPFATDESPKSPRLTVYNHTDTTVGCAGRHEHISPVALAHRRHRNGTRVGSDTQEAKHPPEMRVFCDPLSRLIDLMRALALFPSTPRYHHPCPLSHTH